MSVEEPLYLLVGTEVSAKYRGAFCEARVTKLQKCVKCKVTLKEGNAHVVVLDDNIKGVIKVGFSVEVKHPENGQFVEAYVNKITDASAYTVVFDDGDESTLRRTQLCLKGEKHFVKTDTLDELPLTNPEHFGTPVMKGSKTLKRKKSSANSESDSEDEKAEANLCDKRIYKRRLQDLVGQVVCVQVDDRKKTMWVPVLVVQPGADSIQLRTRDHLLVKSFKDSKFCSVLRKDTKEFTREMAMKNEEKTLKATYEKALLYFDARELPQGWDKEDLLGCDSEEEAADETSDDEPNEEKDHFVAQLYKFMDDRATPINKAPSIAGRDFDLFKLFRLVQILGGYNRVTNQMKWRMVYSKMNLPPSSNAANQIKAAYKKYLHAFEDFYRKLGNMMGTISRPARSRHSSSRSLLSFREREPAAKSPRASKKLHTEASNRKEKNEAEKDDTSDSKPGEKNEKTRQLVKEAEPTDMKTRSKTEDKTEKTSDLETPRRPARGRYQDRKSLTLTENEESKVQDHPNKFGKNLTLAERKQVKDEAHKTVDQTTEDEKKPSKDQKRAAAEDTKKMIEDDSKKGTKELIKRGSAEQLVAKDTQKTGKDQKKVDDQKTAREDPKNAKSAIQKKRVIQVQKRIITPPQKFEPTSLQTSIVSSAKKPVVLPKRTMNLEMAKKLIRGVERLKKVASKTVEDVKAEKALAEAQLQTKQEPKTAQEDQKVKKEVQKAVKKKAAGLSGEANKQPDDTKSNQEDQKCKKEEQKRKTVSGQTEPSKQPQAPTVKRARRKIVRRGVETKNTEMKKPEMKVTKKEESNSGSSESKSVKEGPLVGMTETKTGKEISSIGSAEMKVGKEDKNKPRSHQVYPPGTKLQIRYGRGKNHKVYEAKVVRSELEDAQVHYLVHYAGWNARYDEWIKKERIIGAIGSVELGKKHKPKMSAFKSFQQKRRFALNPPPPLHPLNSVRNLSRKPILIGRSRPTRSSSVELSLSTGLPPKQRRTRRSSGPLDTSEQSSQASESESEESETSDPPKSEVSKPEVPAAATIETKLRESTSEQPVPCPVIKDEAQASTEEIQLKQEPSDNQDTVASDVTKDKPNLNINTVSKDSESHRAPSDISLKKEDSDSSELRIDEEMAVEADSEIGKTDSLPDIKDDQVAVTVKEEVEVSESQSDKHVPVLTRAKRRRASSENKELEIELETVVMDVVAEDVECPSVVKEIVIEDTPVVEAVKPVKRKLKVPKEKTEKESPDVKRLKVETGVKSKIKPKDDKFDDMEAPSNVMPEEIEVNTLPIKEELHDSNEAVLNVPSKSETSVNVEAVDDVEEEKKTVKSRKFEESDEKPDEIECDKNPELEFTVPDKKDINLLKEVSTDSGLDSVKKSDNKDDSESEDISKTLKMEENLNEPCRRKKTRVVKKVDCEQGEDVLLEKKPARILRKAKDDTTDDSEPEKKKIKVRKKKQNKDESYLIGSEISEKDSSKISKPLCSKDLPLLNIASPKHVPATVASRDMSVYDFCDAKTPDPPFGSGSPPYSHAPRLDKSAPVWEAETLSINMDQPAPHLSPVYSGCMQMGGNNQGSVSSDMIRNSASHSSLHSLAETASLHHTYLATNTKEATEKAPEPQPSCSTSITKPANTVFDNTPPDTPEHCPMRSPSSSEEDSQGALDACYIDAQVKAEPAANMEVETLSNTESCPPSLGETNSESSPPSGGESPNACDTSTISNGSGGSSGNAPESESEGGANLIRDKRKPDREGPSTSKKRKRGHRRSSDKHKHTKDISKQAMSDSDDMDNPANRLSPTKQMASHSPSSSGNSRSAQHCRPLRVSKYHFLESLEEGRYLEGESRINFLMEKIQEMRKIYMQLKAEVACIDRRRKRHRRKERDIPLTKEEVEVS